MAETIKDGLKDREGEKGAVMVMVLLISALLLIASAGILLETTLNTANVSDSTADQQSYNAAEGGIQSALNVLRGNVSPSPLLDTSKPATDPANQISFSRALKNATSNLSSDSSRSPRLSRWGLPYNTDRVIIGGNTDYGFSLFLSDPENVGNAVTYNTNTGTSGFYNSSTLGYDLTKTIGNGANTVTLTYTPVTSNTVNVSSGSANVNYGSFNIAVSGLGASIPSGGIPFQITIKMTVPYTATRIMRGNITAGTITPLSSGTVKFDFYSGAYDLVGSIITLNSNPLTPSPIVLGSSVTAINGSTTPVEPRKILIRSTGYGPRGSQKQLEAIVQKNYFDGLGAPATLTLIGASPGFVFNAGNSANVSYSGDDVVSTLNIPSIGVTNTTNLTYVNNNLPRTLPDPPAADITAELPDWLKDPYALDTTIQNLYNVAYSSGRYFRSEVSSPSSFGDNFSATGITFIDGNGSLSGSGGGILVCTGNLTFDGAVNFNGLIIVTGSGGLSRNGGGGATLQGNTVVAPYANNRIYSSTGSLVDKSGITTSTAFLAPKYNINGGGNSNIEFNSSSVANGLNAIRNLVLAVAEK